jgi:hypothetical protein
MSTMFSLPPKAIAMACMLPLNQPVLFEVRELGHGNATIALDYRIVAKRKGYEQACLAELKAEGDTHNSGVKFAEK